MTTTRAAYCGISIPSTLPSILAGCLGKFIGPEQDQYSGESGSHYRHPRGRGYTGPVYIPPAAHLRAAGLGALADLGFRGLDNDILAP